MIYNLCLTPKLSHSIDPEGKECYTHICKSLYFLLSHLFWCPHYFKLDLYSVSMHNINDNTNIYSCFQIFYFDVSSCSFLINHVALMYELPDASLNISFYWRQPAQIAGCGTVVLATPPSQDGSICKVSSLPLHASSLPCFGIKSTYTSNK